MRSFPEAVTVSAQKALKSASDADADATLSDGSLSQPAMTKPAHNNTAKRLVSITVTMARDSMTDSAPAKVRNNIIQHPTKTSFCQ
tara:strand:- start:303 stop:560 length:258 start_codon:yes stop_codon:yes gene_type:complete